MPHRNSRPHRRLLVCISRLLRHSPSTEELSSVVRATFRLLSIVIFAAAPPLPRIRRQAHHTALCSTTRGLKSEARWAPRVTGAGTEPRPAKSRGNWRMTKQSVSVQAWSEHASPARCYPYTHITEEERLLICCHLLSVACSRFYQFNCSYIN